MGRGEFTYIKPGESVEDTTETLKVIGRARFSVGKGLFFQDDNVFSDAVDDVLDNCGDTILYNATFEDDGSSVIVEGNCSN